MPRAKRSAPIATLGTDLLIALCCKYSLINLFNNGGDIVIRIKAFVRGRMKWIYGASYDRTITDTTDLRWFDYNEYYEELKVHIIRFNDTLESPYCIDTEEVIEEDW